MARCHRCYIAMKRAEEDEDSDAAAYQDGYRDGARTRRAGLEPASSRRPWCSATQTAIRRNGSRGQQRDGPAPRAPRRDEDHEAVAARGAVAAPGAPERRSAVANAFETRPTRFETQSTRFETSLSRICPLRTPQPDLEEVPCPTLTSFRAGTVAT